MKQTSLALFRVLAFSINGGRALYDEYYNDLYPAANLSRIGAVYTQSGTVYYTNTHDSLKASFVLTAYYDNGTSEIVGNYVLSGILGEGTGTFTVMYDD